eukprot:GFYU01000696.1.p1 GENE.GFYU01000696.1~~GFYU01000696.1.p1  ORF type:complete len:239 (+),score=65.45 GFYU01000696.1:112-828(+)
MSAQVAPQQQESGSKKIVRKVLKTQNPGAIKVMAKWGKPKKVRGCCDPKVCARCECLCVLCPCLKCGCCDKLFKCCEMISTCCGLTTWCKEKCMCKWDCCLHIKSCRKPHWKKALKESTWVAVYENRLEVNYPYLVPASCCEKAYVADNLISWHFDMPMLARGVNDVTPCMEKMCAKCLGSYGDLVLIGDKYKFIACMQCRVPLNYQIRVPSASEFKHALQGAMSNHDLDEPYNKMDR